MRTMAAALLVILIGIPIAEAGPAAVTGWPGGTALVKSYGPDGGLTVGRIESDGTLLLELPTPSPTTQTVDQTFMGGCSGEGDMSAGPLDVQFTPTSLYAERDGKELGALHIATSPEVVAWRDSFNQTDAAQGAWYQWVYVSAAAEVMGQCAGTVYTNADASESFERLSEHNVKFTKGWNLMQNAILVVHADSSGKRHAQHEVTDVVPAMPENAAWYFVAY